MLISAFIFAIVLLYVASFCAFMVNESLEIRIIKLEEAAKDLYKIADNGVENSVLVAGVLFIHLFVGIIVNSFVTCFYEVHYSFFVSQIFLNVRKCWLCFEIVKR